MKMSEGQHRVGVNFNPSGSGEVDKVKHTTAGLIDQLEAIALNREHPGARAAAVAMTYYETAAMWR